MARLGVPLDAVFDSHPIGLRENCLPHHTLVDSGLYMLYRKFGVLGYRESLRWLYGIVELCLSVAYPWYCWSLYVVPLPPPSYAACPLVVVSFSHGQPLSWMLYSLPRPPS